MAITTNSIVVGRVPIDGKEWTVSKYSADLSGCEELLAAETGKCHWVTKLLINTVTTLNVSVGSGETTNAVTTVYLGPIQFTAAQPTLVLDFVDLVRGNRGMKVASGTALTADSSASGAIFIYAEGKTCDA